MVIMMKIVMIARNYRLLTIYILHILLTQYNSLKLVRLYLSSLYMEAAMVICNFSLNNILVFIWVQLKICYVSGCKIKLHKYEDHKTAAGAIELD